MEPDLKIKAMPHFSRCPRCYAPQWGKEGLEYKDRFGANVQLWKCRGCNYEEERFAE